MAATLPSSSHLSLYYLVIDGGAVVDLEAGSSIQLQPGDVLCRTDMLHYSGSGADHCANYGITAKIKARDLSLLHAGGGGEIPARKVLYDVLNLLERLISADCARL